MDRVLAYAGHGFLPMEALISGVEKVSSFPVIRRGTSLYGGNDYERCTACLVFGAKEPVNRVLRDQRDHDTPVLVADLGYIKRGNVPDARADPDNIYWSVNLNGLNGWGGPPRSGMPKDRWRALDIPIAPWQSSGGHYVVCGQKPHDAAIDGVNPQRWLIETVTHLRSLTDAPIRWRPHPDDHTNRRLDIHGQNITKSFGTALAEDLKGAIATVAFNSNSLVESLIAGVPIYVLGGGSVCPDMGHSLLTEDTLSAPLHPERAPFFADLAYRQWTIPEFEQGLPWLHFFAALVSPHNEPPHPVPAPARPRRKRRASPPISPGEDTHVVPTAIPSSEEFSTNLLSVEALTKTIHRGD